MAVYTSGDWHVTPGKEAEFVRAWQSFAQQSVSDDATSQGTLLRDNADPSHFISFGNWPDAQTVESWRSSSAFQENFAKLRALTESAQIKDYEIAAQTQMLTAAR